MVTYLAGGIIRSGGNTKMIMMIDIAGKQAHWHTNVPACRVCI